MATLSEDIRSWGKKLGFSLIGFAKAEALDEEGANLDKWLLKKYHGTMEWMERSARKRSDPFALLPGAKSVIVCAINYFHPDIQINTPIGRISRYAWGDDYHKVIKDKLNELWKLIILRKPDAKSFIEVDSGPIMEKAWAKRAGIGWQGKHSLILNQEFGSWIFLGTIVTDIELEYDSPAADLCGDCKLCLDACPTRAIAAPYLLDASKCISYFTIEHQEKIDNNIARNFGEWIFGCDICQNVCPWNQKKAKNAVAPEFKPREYSNGIGFEKILAMNEDEFNRVFENSPIIRRKLEGMKANVRNVSITNKMN